MSRYKANKQDAISYNDEPTKTDQSQAAQTDINIIVTQFLRTGQAPQATPPTYGDFTELPVDLRDLIELGRSIKTNQANLPQQLQGIPLAELVNMTNEQITAKLTPPQPTTQEPKT